MQDLSCDTLSAVSELLSEQENARIAQCTKLLLTKMTKMPRLVQHYSIFNIKKHLTQLPIQLRFISIQGIKCGQNSLRDLLLNLPPNLHGLYLHPKWIVTVLLDREVATALPRTLTFLDIGCCNVTRQGLKRLPNLLTLRMHPNSRIDNLFGLLPRSITEFVICGSVQNGLRHLPRNLRHLELLCTGLVDADLAQLPHNLLHLKIDCNNTFTSGCVQYLPPNLTILDLAKELHYIGMNPRATTEWIEALPRTLARLQMWPKNLGDWNVPDMPRYLTELDISACSEMLTDACFLDLPRPLQKLLMCNNQWVDGSGFEHLPPNLTVLDLREASRIKSECTKYLPKYLTSLNICAACTLRNEHLKDLPRYLTTLDISRASRLTDAGICHLPARLKELYISDAELLTDAAIKDLPRTLTTLDISKNRHLTDTCAVCLPDRLTKLDLDGNELFTDLVFDHLPRSLRTILLRGNPNITRSGLVRFCVPGRTVTIRHRPNLPHDTETNGVSWLSRCLLKFLWYLLVLRFQKDKCNRYI